MSLSLSAVLEGAFKAGLARMERILSVVCFISSIGPAARAGAAIAIIKQKDPILRTKRRGFMSSSRKNSSDLPKNELGNQFFHIDGRLGFPNPASWFDDLLGSSGCNLDVLLPDQTSGLDGGNGIFLDF